MTQTQTQTHTAEAGDVLTLLEAAEAVMAAFDADCVSGDLHLPDDPAYGLYACGSIKLTTGMVARLRAALAASPAPRAPAAVSEELRRALEAVAEAASYMPRKTPAPGGSCTVHPFQIMAADVWALDRALANLDATRTLAAAPAAPPADGGADGLREALTKLVKMASPFAHRIYNDNGDVSVSDTHLVSYEQWVDLYFAHRQAEAALSSRTLAGAEGDPVGLTLTALHQANIVRQAEWCAGGDPEPDLAFRGVELAGETGEALNVIKKLERERRGWRGSRASLTDLAEELADVVICADLCAVSAGIDLGTAVVAKFNATSAKVGLTTMLPTSRPASPAPAASAGGTTEIGCVLCGLPRSEHHYNGAAYGVCGEFAALAPAAQVNPGREEILAEALQKLDHWLFWYPAELAGVGEIRKIIADALAARPVAEGDAKTLERVRHVKRGTEYEVLGEAMGQQLDEYGEPHPHSLVIYRKVGSKRLSWILPSELPNHFVPAARPAPSPAKGGAV